MRARSLVLTLLVAVAGAGAAGGATAATPAQLALMPLPKSALPPAAASLPLDRQSGVVSNAAAAADAAGDVSAKRLARLGRVTGYSLDYADAGLAALVAGKGLLGIETSVDLYRDARAARAGLAFWRADEARFASLERSGVAIAFRPVAAPTVGDERWSYGGTVTVRGKPPIHGVVVAFRVGTLTADVTVTAADERTARAFVATLARRLEARIRGVLRGDVDGPATPLPARPKAGPPPNGMDLAAMAVRPADLGGGKVQREGFELDTDLNPISAFSREIVGSPFPAFRETVELFHSPLEAGFSVALLEATLALDRREQPGRKVGPNEVAFARTTATAVRAGDEARALSMQVRFGDGTALNEGVVLVRVGSVVAWVAVATPANVRIPRQALEQLARVAASRVEAGLQSSKVA
jgi:hypothetical protein